MTNNPELQFLENLFSDPNRKIITGKFKSEYDRNFMFIQEI